MKNKLLFITLSNIGDAIMTTPVLEYMFKKNPNCIVDVVCDKKSYEVFEFCPFVNKIFIKDKSKGFLGNLTLLKELRKENYNIAIDLRTDIYLHLIHSKQKFFKVNNTKIHSVEKHFASLGLNEKIIKKTKFWISKKIEQESFKLIKKKDQKILSIGLGANSSFKIWPTENYIKLSNYLKEKFDLILLVGSNEDRKYSNKFISETKLNTIDFCGKLSLSRSAAIIKLSDYFVGNDSGLGHIASAFGVPSFTIFGEGQPERYSPWGPQAEWYQNKEKKIDEIKPEIIRDLILQVLED